MKARILKIAKELLNVPTAPFREAAVREHILDFCRQRGIKTKVDQMGNILAEYGASRGKSVVLAAHMDHPGFIIEKDSLDGSAQALFYGGVDEEYFINSAVRVFTSDGQVKGKVIQTHFDLKKKQKRVRLSVKGKVRAGDLAMWDLPAFRLRDDRLYSRACDDLIGCCASLAVLDEMTRAKANGNFKALFTVAEEAGLHGAKFACLKGLIPRDSVILSIETSAALPSAPIGGGVVVRVGDRVSVFSQAVTACLEHLGRDLSSKRRSFRYQRKLMDAGRCESSVFAEFSLTAGALCIPLGNYHNRCRRTKKIAPEYISISDLENMVHLLRAFVEAGIRTMRMKKRGRPRFTKRTGRLGEIFWE